MELLQKIFSKFSPRDVKYLIVNMMGLMGIVIALAAFLLTEDQSALLSQVNQGLFQSPLGSVISSITTLFYC